MTTFSVDKLTKCSQTLSIVCSCKCFITSSDLSYLLSGHRFPSIHTFEHTHIDLISSACENFRKNHYIIESRKKLKLKLKFSSPSGEAPSWSSFPLGSFSSLSWLMHLLPKRLGVGDVTLPNEGHTGCPVPMVSLKNKHACNIIQNEQVIFRNTYTYTYRH